MRQRWQWAFAAVVVCQLLLVTSTWKNSKKSHQISDQLDSHNRGHTDIDSDDDIPQHERGQPIYEVLQNGEEHIETVRYMPITRVKGVLFIAHGCSHSAIDWFVSAPLCERCFGLIEERIISETAVRNGWAVVTVSSVDRFFMCWGWGDLKRVIYVLETFRNRFGLQTFPTAAFGVSSGGHFVAELAASTQAKSLRLKAVAVQISSAAGLVQSINIPVLFIHMPRDTVTARHVDDDIQHLRSRAILASAVTCDPLKLSPTFLSNSIPEVSTEASTNIFEMLKSIGMIDESGYLSKDPRESMEWRSKAREYSQNDTLVPDLSSISEVLNKAYAIHEICSEHSKLMLDFFENPEKTCANQLTC